MLESLITSNTRLRLLIKFFVNSKTQIYLRGLADKFGESTNAIRKEFNNLANTAILLKESDKNEIASQTNVGNPFFSNIQIFNRKYLVLDKLLDRIWEVNQVIHVGDLFSGIESAKIGVVVIGDNLGENYKLNFTSEIEELIN